MSDPKSERLINLTMALLATRRYLLKSEIFQSVAGYSGTPEAMERMFERDKDDLRSLGIVIEVGSHDPLFSDEAGYRISPDAYAINLEELAVFEALTSIDLALISVAASAWRGAVFSNSAQSALLKFDSLGIPAPHEYLPFSLEGSEVSEPLFEQVWRAIKERREITFTYLNPSKSTRRVNPYGVSLWHGYWYLVGLDVEKQEIRTFKVARCQADLTVGGTPSAYEVPQDFSIKNWLVMNNEVSISQVAEIRLRIGTCLQLRRSAMVEPIEASEGEWDLARLPYNDPVELISLVARHGANAQIVKPDSLRNAMIDFLQAKAL